MKKRIILMSALVAAQFNMNADYSEVLKTVKDSVISFWDKMPSLDYLKGCTSGAQTATKEALVSGLDYAQVYGVAAKEAVCAGAGKIVSKTTEIASDFASEPVPQALAAGVKHASNGVISASNAVSGYVANDLRADVSLYSGKALDMCQTTFNLAKEKAFNSSAVVKDEVVKLVQENPYTLIALLTATTIYGSYKAYKHFKNTPVPTVEEDDLAEVDYGLIYIEPPF